MTYADLITRALQDLQVTDGTTADPNDVALALDRLNDWIDALALEGLTIPSISRVTWTIGSGTTSYTVGSGSTVNVSKPVSPQAISNLGYADTSLTTPQEILFGRVLTEAEYQGIPQGRVGRREIGRLAAREQGVGPAGFGGVWRGRGRRIGLHRLRGLRVRGGQIQRHRASRSGRSCRA